MSHCQRNVLWNTARPAELLLECMVHTGRFHVVVCEGLRFSLLFLCCAPGSVVSAYKLLRKGSELERVPFRSVPRLPAVEKGWFSSFSLPPSLLLVLVTVGVATCVETHFYRNMRKPEGS